MRPLHKRLRARQAEMEEAILARVLALIELDDLDSYYADGLRRAVAAAVDYALSAVEAGGKRISAPPPALYAQARLAARSGVNLDSVMRRYFAGHSLLLDFVVEEAELDGPIPSAELQRLLGAQASVFDRVLVAISEEHTHERTARHRSSEECEERRVERLLAGELLDTSQFTYDFEAHHIGAIVQGPGVLQAIRELAGALDRRLLTVRRGEQEAWVWLGGRRPVEPEEISRLASTISPPGLLTVGEPAHGLRGWRLSHRQAKAARTVALRSGNGFTRYADIALLSLVMRNRLLASSLRQVYLTPLDRERDGGALARQTLRVYFAAGRNASSAAALLGLSRQAVTNRLKAIEGIFQRPLTACGIELEIALKVEELGLP